jgi:hypothetical protein
VCILDVVITSRYCSREDICKPIIVDSESFNWTRSHGFFLHTEGFSTYTNFGVLLVVVAGFIFLHRSWVS